MEIDLALINGYHEFTLSAEFYFQTKKLGKRAVIITPNYYEFKKLKRQGVKAIYIKDYFPKKNVSKEEIKSYFQNKGVLNLNSFIATEKAYYNNRPNEICQYAYNYAKAFEKIFEEFKIKKIFQIQGGEVVRRSATLIAEILKIRTIYVGESFIPGYSTLYSNEHKSLIVPDNGVKTLSDEEAKLIISNKLERKTIIEYTPLKTNYHKGNKIVKLYTLLIKGNLNILKNYIYHIYKRKLKHHFLEKVTLKYFDEFDSDKMYFYFPFNVAAESELFIRNEDYINQISTVINISKILPKNTYLYVKPHPGDEGHLSINEYKELKKLANVKLLRANLNSFEVVTKSKGVIIVSSTVGLESYIMNKPTCVLGNWPYRQMGSFIITDDISKIPHLLLSKSDNNPVNFIKKIASNSHLGHLFGSKQEFDQLIKTLVHI